MNEWTKALNEIEHAINNGDSYDDVMEITKSHGIKLKNIETLKSAIYRFKKKGMIDIEVRNQTRGSSKEDRIWYKAFVIFSLSNGYNLNYAEIDCFDVEQVEELFEMTHEEAVELLNMAKKNKNRKVADLTQRKSDEVEKVAVFLSEEWTPPIGFSDLDFLDMDLDLYFINKNNADYDPEYTQLVSYVIVTCGEEVLVAKRSFNSGDDRLKGALTLGFGGHYNNEDKDIEACARREVSEETTLPYSVDMNYKGIIYSTETEIDREHLGFLYTVNLSNKNVSITSEHDNYYWTTIADVKDNVQNFETWSQIVIEEAL